jgi:hypothetical protein
MTIEQDVFVPLHAPPHPENAEPGAGVAVSVTDVSPANDAVQVDPQLMPAGDEVTVPLPDLLMASEYVGPLPSHWYSAAP